MSENFPNAISALALQRMLATAAPDLLPQSTDAEPQPEPQSKRRSTQATATRSAEPTWVSITVASKQRMLASQYRELTEQLAAFIKPMAIGPLHHTRTSDGTRIEMAAKIKGGDLKSVEAFVLSLAADDDAELFAQVTLMD